MDVPAGVTQEEGHAGFLIHLPFAVHACLYFYREKDSEYLYNPWSQNSKKKTRRNVKGEVYGWMKSSLCYTNGSLNLVPFPRLKPSFKRLVFVSAPPPLEILAAQGENRDAERRVGRAAPSDDGIKASLLRGVMHADETFFSFKVRLWVAYSRRTHYICSHAPIFCDYFILCIPEKFT